MAHVEAVAEALGEPPVECSLVTPDRAEQVRIPLGGRERMHQQMAGRLAEFARQLRAAVFEVDERHVGTTADAGPTVTFRSNIVKDPDGVDTVVAPPGSGSIRHSRPFVDTSRRPPATRRCDA